MTDTSYEPPTVRPDQVRTRRIESPHRQRRAVRAEREIFTLEQFRGIADDGVFEELVREYRPASMSSPGQPRFQLGEPLGTGGQGKVFVLEDSDCNRDCAVKALDVRDPGLSRIRRFVHEAQVTAQLEHPGIVPVYDIGVLGDGTVFYTMKRIEGEPLNKLLVRTGGQVGSRFEFLQIVLKVCDALAFAHARGVVHRDLKPSNVMTGEYGEVLLLDWGLCKVLGDPEIEQPQVASGEYAAGDITLPGSTLGTPLFMSPEQAAGEMEAVDGRSDIFSLGVILYEMLLGQSPYHPLVAVEDILEALIAGRWTRPAAVEQSAAVPKQLLAIVEKAMAPDRADRYQQVEDLAADLRAFLSEQAVSAYRESLLERTWRCCRRHRTAIVGVLVACAALLVGSITVGMVQRARIRNQVETLRQQARQAELDDDPARARGFYEKISALLPDSVEVGSKLAVLDGQARERQTRTALRRQACRFLDQARHALAKAGPGDLRTCADKVQHALEILPRGPENEDIRRDLLAVFEEVTSTLASEEAERKRRRAAALLAEAHAAVDAEDYVAARIAHEKATALITSNEETRSLLRTIEAGENEQRRILERRQAERRARELLAAARESYAAERYATALNRLDAARALHELPEAKPLYREVLLAQEEARQAERLAEAREQLAAWAKEFARAIKAEQAGTAHLRLVAIEKLQRQIPALDDAFDDESATVALTELRRRLLERRSDRYIVRAETAMGTAEQDAVEIDRLARELDALILREESAAEERARIPVLQVALDRKRRERQERLQAALGQLYQALALTDDYPRLQRCFARYFADRLLEAEALGQAAQVTAYAEQGKHYDVDGHFEECFDGIAVVVNAGEEEMVVTPLELQADGCRGPAVDRARRIPAGGELELPSGDYQLAVASGAVQVRRLRGSASRLSWSLPTAPPRHGPARDLAFVPGGTVVHRHRLTGERRFRTRRVRPFLLARHEVTCGEYLAYLNDPATLQAFAAIGEDEQLRIAPREFFRSTEPKWPYQEPTWPFDPGGFSLPRDPVRPGETIDPRVPVTNVSYEDIQGYLRWRRRRDGLRWRLPTDAEWQLAVSGQDGRTYPWGDYANAGLCYSGLHNRGRGCVWRPVGSFATDRSVQGIFDLAGSVAEFVVPALVPGRGERHAMFCGGCFTNKDCTHFAAYSRRYIDRRAPVANLGFRLALDLAEWERWRSAHRR